MLGRVLWFNSKKGYGFIKNNEGKELFFHYSNISNIDGYKYTYSGTPVNYESYINDKEEEVISDVKILERVTATNKPIVLVAFYIIHENSNLVELNFDILRKAESGIHFLRHVENIIICTNKKITNYEAENIKTIIGDIINNLKDFPVNKVVPTNAEYDIIFI